LRQAGFPTWLPAYLKRLLGRIMGKRSVRSLLFVSFRFAASAQWPHIFAISMMMALLFAPAVRPCVDSGLHLARRDSKPGARRGFAPARQVRSMALLL
jgi:hypothetical protein